MKPLTIGASTLIGCMAMFGIGFGMRDLVNGRAPDLGLLTNGGKSASPQDEALVESTFDSVKSDFYKPINGKDLEYAALSGMVASLGDPHTIFLPPKEKEQLNFTTTANFYGIGCSLLDVPKGVRIQQVFDGSPAQAAGIKPGDVIVSVNGSPIAGTQSTKVVNQIRGPEGTYVQLGVLRGGKGDPEPMSVRRAQIFAPTVMGHYDAADQVGLVSIATFSEPTVSQFDAEIAKFKGKPLKGLVIDLRGNPGGLLTTAVDLLSRFVDNKVVVRMKQRDGAEEVAKTSSDQLLNLGIPIVVLVNQESASASEIFTGVMRDYGVATIVGNHTYGKASVQNVYPMIDKAGVKITIARYYLPITPDISRKVDADGQYVSGGLIPDVKVDMPPNAAPVPFDPKSDPQLAKAIQVLLQKAKP